MRNLITPKPIMTAFWLISWALAMSLGWLLPNHYMPWVTFHVEVWSAGIVLLAIFAIITRSTAEVHWNSMALFIAALIPIPGIQYTFGLIGLAGTAWISSAYLIAFLLATLAGSIWERSNPKQMIEGLFLSFGVAAILSVGLQLYQWLKLDYINDIWIIKNSTGRPFGNLGQPNELATLLIWGLLATAWGFIRRHLGAKSSLFISIYILFGLALTQSRTAWLAILLLVFSSWIWRKHWNNHLLPQCTTLLSIYFLICVLSINWLTEILLLSSPSDILDFARLSSGKRPLIWSIFFDAMTQKITWGYGWNQNVQALLQVALDHPALNEVAMHSHNIFLDFIIWCGAPIGLFISFFLVLWLWIQICAVKSAENALIVLVLLVVCNHAMLELPLHHGFFLLPTGLLIGVLSVQSDKHTVLKTRRWSVAALWIAAVTLLALFIRDYAHIETSYLGVRLEKAHIHTEKRASVPDVVLLTQWAEFIRMAQTEATEGISNERIDEMRIVVETFAQAGQMFTFAKVLALNNKPEEAQLWLRKVCTIDDPDLCNAFKKEWQSQSVQQLAPWPI